ncbi:MAG: hypothetical protein K2W78_10460 [Xanthobacteraceae bacterium]|nr:hypothetical protein [Xanthobacteraceae bacterium]
MLTGLCGMAAPRAALADDIFKIAPLQRIACTRALLPGKQQVISCKSFAYVLNAHTSEFYRCQVSVGVTRNAKEILKTDSDGNCILKTRVFPVDSSYSFDATETEPPNTNAFFGSGGTAIWVTDTAKQSVRGCIGLVMGIEPDILKCIDMTFSK